MSDDMKADICVIGAGSAGLSIAAGAAQMGADTILIESGKMGGDCLNYGCVPSKALLAAAKAAKMGSKAGRFGVHYEAPRIDFAAVHDHIEGVIAAIAPHDSVERFEDLGVRVLQARARFLAPDLVEAGGRRVRARRFVVATGSSPLVPPIPGLEGVPYLTNETVFDLKTCPERLIVIGGGPIGCELGQAFRRLGAAVSIVEMAAICPKDDPELVALLRERLTADGIDLLEGAKVTAVAKTPGGVRVHYDKDATAHELEGGTLLLAAGRRPNLADLGLEAAGIAHDRAGITVDRRLRTSNRKVFAAGDVAGGPQFTHMAGYHAGIVIRNALFRLPAKVDDAAVPWVTFSDPELAQVGLGEAEARQRYGEIRVLRWPFAENDRAQTERETDGLVKVITRPRGQILGASIVGAHAGELIHIWGLAISKGLKIGALAGMIAPYPTLGEAGKRAAGSFYSDKLFGAGTRRLVAFLRLFG